MQTGQQLLSWLTISRTSHMAPGRRVVLSLQEKGFPIMKIFLKGLLCRTLAVSAMSAQDKDKVKKMGSSAVPPIIDRELIFGNPEISGAQLSPDGKYLAFQKPWKDTRNIWVKR